MSLARGKFGIEYNPRQREKEPFGFGLVLAVAALAAIVALTWTLVRRVRASAAEERDLASLGVRFDQEQSVAPPPAPAATAATFLAFKPLKADLAQRPPKVRNLLMRLEEAERRRDIEMAVTTIEAIRALPGSPAADLDDSLARRLGALNIRRLFDLRSAQWVKTVTVGRGDSASRLAVENGSTFASLARLNGGREKVEMIVVGRQLHVMNHPRFGLVIHRRPRFADLSLNGKFFRRYDLRGEVGASDGAYQVPEGRRAFWNSLGAPFAPSDQAELDLLMPNGAPVLVSDL